MIHSSHVILGRAVGRHYLGRSGLPLVADVSVQKPRTYLSINLFHLAGSGCRISSGGCPSEHPPLWGALQVLLGAPPLIAPYRYVRPCQRSEKRVRLSTLSERPKVIGRTGARTADGPGTAGQQRGLPMPQVVDGGGWQTVFVLTTGRRIQLQLLLASASTRRLARPRHGPRHSSKSARPRA
jgi:hypothetical protein